MDKMKYITINVDLDVIILLFDMNYIHGLYVTHTD